MENRYIGLRFGKLTVLEIADDKTYNVKGNIRRLKRYIVRCDCGNKAIVFGQDLKSGKTRSCGQNECKLQYNDRSMPAFNAIVKGYKDSAIKRGYIFELTHNDMHRLTKLECYYCGVIESQTRKIKSGNNTSEYRYNGIDRVDNDKGYTLDNVVSCCNRCNIAKNDMTHDEFIALCKRIAERHV